MYNYFYLTFLRVAAGALIFRRPRRNPGGRDMTVRAGVVIFTHTHRVTRTAQIRLLIFTADPRTRSRGQLWHAGYKFTHTGVTGHAYSAVMIHARDETLAF